MITRTVVALAGGVIAAFVALVGGWLIVTAYEVVGWEVPVAAGVAVFTALWVIDYLSDYFSKRA